VSWTAPVTDNQVYPVHSQVIQLTVNATDNVGVTRVYFSRWDAVNLRRVEIGNVYSLPFQIDLDCSVLNYDWNEIDVQAYDAAGNISSQKYIW